MFESIEGRPAASLEGKVAFITGSGRGMGQAHALLMAHRGADIVIHDVNKDWAEETGEKVRATGRKALVFVEDVADVKAMAENAKRAESEMGRIDILVNNAGIGGERTGIEGVEEDFFDRMFNIHVRGHFFLTKAVVPGMKERKYGRILNVSSMWVMMGHHYGATYTAAKSALLGLTKSWAKEFAPWGITVNAIAPGGVMSQMAIEKDGLEAVMARAKTVPLGRFAELDENAALVAFLCSDEAAFITGQTIGPNGGQAIVGI
ncbi:MAG: SDR family oxidoreductase [Proteobacteria bacterium]|nr:SDR family oxidoreductase [Pseudomonadota bacterium]